MKLTENTVVKGWIVGSFKDDGLSFAKFPEVHSTEQEAKAEAARLAHQHGRKFIWVKVGGAVKASTLNWE